MHDVIYTLLVGVLTCAPSTSAQGGVETLSMSWKDALVKADYPPLSRYVTRPSQQQGEAAHACACSRPQQLDRPLCPPGPLC